MRGTNRRIYTQLLQQADSTDWPGSPKDTDTERERESARHSLAGGDYFDDNKPGRGNSWHSITVALVS